MNPTVFYLKTNQSWVTFGRAKKLGFLHQPWVTFNRAKK
jgi:hypothetical protein